jgi:hypothetical protein
VAKTQGRTRSIRDRAPFHTASCPCPELSAYTSALGLAGDACDGLVPVSPGCSLRDRALPTPLDFPSEWALPRFGSQAFRRESSASSCRIASSIGYFTVSSGICSSPQPSQFRATVPLPLRGDRAVPAIIWPEVSKSMLAQSLRRPNLCKVLLKAPRNTSYRRHSPDPVIMAAQLHL